MGDMNGGSNDGTAGGEDPGKRLGNEPASASRSWFVLVPVGALLLGLLVGGLVVGVATSGSDGAGSPTPVPSASSSSEGAGTAVVVPDSCLAAASTVQEATQRIRDGVSAIRDFDADAIIGLLNQLEDLDAQARQQAATCTGTRVSDAPLTGSPTSPTSPTSP